MNTLWTFGDSFTFGWGMKHHKWHNNKGKNYLNNWVTPNKHKPWPDILSEKLNMNLRNCGVNGYSNYDIINTIIEETSNIKKGDIVVIAKSYSGRRRFPVDGEWRLFTSGAMLQTLEDKMNSHQIDLVGMDKFKTIIDYEYYFAHDPLYKEQQDTIFNYLVETLWKINNIGNAVITSIDEMRPNDGVETILRHTNGKIKDYHPSVNGHRTIANRIYSQITNDNRDNLI